MLIPSTKTGLFLRYMNWIDMTVVTFCGIALLMTVWLGNTDLAGTIAVGLLGYLGGKASDVVK